ncbi:MAG: hypothetical protein QM791_18710 [Ferruginibacter sp.]
MIQRFFRKEIHDMGALFNGHFVDVKAFYAWQFNKVPCVSFVGEIDVSKAFPQISERYKYSIKAVYQHAWHDHSQDKMLFNNSIFVLDNNRMIELANDYCQILFTPSQYDWASQAVKDVAAFRKTAETKQTRVMGFARQPGSNNN